MASARVHNAAQTHLQRDSLFQPLLDPVLDHDLLPVPTHHMHTLVLPIDCHRALVHDADLLGHDTVGPHHPVGHSHLLVHDCLEGD